jgi:chitin disaccharide deacetylase
MANTRIIIVNSDDFGLSKSVNEATLRGFESGVISSTTLMVSMEGFEDAVEKTHQNPILKNAIGLHLNLTEGTPLTDAMKSSKLFCRDGQFSYRREKQIFTVPQHEKAALYGEITAQIKKAVDHGIMPTHLDGHHHIHTEFGILNYYIAAAKEFGISKIRLTKNVGKTSAARVIYKNMFNWYIRSVKSMTTTDVFCGANEYGPIMNLAAYKTKNIEIMVHAMLNEKNEVTDIDGINLDEKMKPLLKGENVRSYFDL